MTIGDTVKTADGKSEKHVPVISAPAKINPDAAIEISVAVGAEVPHPNTTEHFIGWITLYFKPKAGPAVCLAKADFTAHGESAKGANQGAAWTEPSLSTKVKLTEPGTLMAMSYCNIHGLWESSVEIGA